MFQAPEIVCAENH